MAASPDGRLLVVGDSSGGSAIELPSGRTVWSSTWAPSHTLSAIWIVARELIVYRGAPGDVLFLDLASGTTRATAKVAPHERRHVVALSHDGRLLARDRGDGIELIPLTR